MLEESKKYYMAKLIGYLEADNRQLELKVESLMGEVSKLEMLNSVYIKKLQAIGEKLDEEEAE